MTTKPLADWDNDDSMHEDLVWWSRLDNRYQVEVHRTGASKAVLYVFDKETEFEVIHKEEVGLAYDAMFGPDVADVYDWQARILDVVDHPEKRVT